MTLPVSRTVGRCLATLGGVAAAAFPVPLPQERAGVTVRHGSLAEDLDVLHEGDRLWWGRDFLADRITTIPDGEPWALLVADLDGRLAGDAFVVGRPVLQDGYAMASIFVRSGARQQGVGTALARVIADATVAWQLPGFAGQTHELDTEARSAVEAMGFREMGHHRESVLDLDRLDVAVAQAAVAKAVGAGIVLRAFDDSAGDDDWQRLYDEVVAPTWRDAPDADGASEVMPLQVFRGFFPDPSYVLVAWRGDRPVGVTAVMDRSKDEALNTMFTGVLPSARGLGVSTALKAQHALTMRDRGQHRLFTQNMDQNTRILAANDRLGFEVVPGYVAVGCAVPWAGPARVTGG